MVVGAFMIIAGLGTFIIHYGLTPTEDAILLAIGAAAVYLGAKVL